MADPLFTTIDYVVTAHTHVEPMARPEPTPVFGPRIERGCDESGFYMLRLIHLVWTTTALPNGHCHICATEVQERYISNEACRLYKPPTDLAEGDEWLSYIEPPPVSYYWPPPDNPRQWIDLGPCEDTTKPLYRVACVGGRLHVTRWLQITMCMPLPDGRCRKLQVLSKPETYKTEKPCEMGDWADAPAGFTGDEDPALLWKQGAALAKPPEEASAPGTLRLGREADRSTSFQPAVRHLAIVVTDLPREPVNAGGFQVDTWDIVAFKLNTLVSHYLDWSHFVEQSPAIRRGTSDWQYRLGDIVSLPLALDFDVTESWMASERLTGCSQACSNACARPPRRTSRRCATRPDPALDLRTTTRATSGMTPTRASRCRRRSRASSPA